MNFAGCSRIGLVAMITSFGVGLCRGEDVAEKTTLGVDAGITYVSKYIWRGYDVFDDHAALQPSTTVDLFGSGFSVNVWGSIPMGTGSNHDNGGINQLQEYDYTLSYGKTFFADEKYAVEVDVNYIYYDLIKLNHTADTQEIGISMALPNLIKIGENSLVPKYYYGQLWPASSGIPAVAGGYHSLGLGYELAIPNTKQTINLSGDINYNDGLFGSDHDWSHATLGIATSFEISCVTITPFLSYQASMDNSVNPEDEVYGGVTASISF